MLKMTAFMADPLTVEPPCTAYDMKYNGGRERLGGTRDHELHVAKATANEGRGDTWKYVTRQCRVGSTYKHATDTKPPLPSGRREVILMLD